MIILVSIKYFRGKKEKVKRGITGFKWGKEEETTTKVLS